MLGRIGWAPAAENMLPLYDLLFWGCYIKSMIVVSIWICVGPCRSINLSFYVDLREAMFLNLINKYILYIWVWFGPRTRINLFVSAKSKKYTFGYRFALPRRINIFFMLIFQEKHDCSIKSAPTHWVCV